MKVLLSVLLVGVVSVAVVNGVNAEKLSDKLKKAKAHGQVEVVRVVAESIRVEPRHVIVIVRSAIRALPSEAVVILVAAVKLHPEAANEIFEAASAIVPEQVARLRKAMDTALALVASRTPGGSALMTSMVTAEIAAHPDMAPTVVSTSIAVCTVLHACPQFGVESIVRAAVAANLGVAEAVVETTVRLVPDQASVVVAAITEEMMMAPRPPITQLQTGDGESATALELPGLPEDEVEPTGGTADNARGRSGMQALGSPFIAPRPNPASPFFLPASPSF